MASEVRSRLKANWVATVNGQCQLIVRRAPVSQFVLDRHFRQQCDAKTVDHALLHRVHRVEVVCSGRTVAYVVWKSCSNRFW